VNACPKAAWHGPADGVGKDTDLATESQEARAKGKDERYIFVK
jgi:hypothetical protein